MIWIRADHFCISKHTFMVNIFRLAFGLVIYLGVNKIVIDLTFTFLAFCKLRCSGSL